MKEIDFKKFKNESYFQKLKAFAKHTPKENLVFVFFGGTGAVGGQALIELIQDFELILYINPEWLNAKPKFVVTGLSELEIERFRTKLYSIFSQRTGHGFEKIENDQFAETKLILKRKSGVVIEFYILEAKPEFTTNLEELIKGKDYNDIKDLLIENSSKISSPFETFLKNYIQIKELGDDFKFQSIISGIPIPSVAAYHFEKIDSLLNEVGLKKHDINREFERVIKIKILHGIANDFGLIKKNLANEVIIAHTTAVGGMYTIENDKPIIRLGYAHSALDEQLLEKQFYANELTKQYSHLRLKVLITAAAIGIDNIAQNTFLPINNGIFKKYIKAAENNILPFPEKFLDRKSNLIFTPTVVSPLYPIENDKGDIESQKKLFFCTSEENSPPKLKVGFGLRSGENGIFSIDNAYALYLNMKIATQEELSHIIAVNSLFGDDIQKPWFDSDGICYQTETENSTLVFSLLNNRSEFRRYQTSGFTPKAFQDLGSAKHQCELHTIGLYMLMHKLKTLNPKLISEKITSKYRDSEVIEFIDKNTDPLAIEDIINYDPKQKALDFSELLTANSPEEIARFIGFNGDLQIGFIYSFFQHLLNVVKQVINTIVSLGTPIIYIQNDKTKVILGPYCSAIDSIISHNDSLAKYIKEDSITYNLSQNDYFEWLVANNGFIDLRPQATISIAKTHKLGLKGKINVVSDLETFEEAIKTLQEESIKDIGYGYFTTSGTVGFIGRIKGLYEQLISFDISLGTLNNWKSLFPVDSNLNHPIIPGLVEAMRMYMEGLGKVTGFELLYPDFGYYKK